LAARAESKLAEKERIMAEKKNKGPYSLGVDIGAARIRAGVLARNGELAGLVKLSTKANRGAETAVERVARCIRDAVDEADLTLQDLRGVGVGVPGPVDPARGLALSSAALGWGEVPLKEMLEHSLGVPVWIESDWNAALLGIHELEFHRAPRQMLGVFIGAGIGGGMIVNGRLFHGFNHGEGELGHMVLDVNGPRCACGRRGCFQALASRTALVNRLRAAIKDGAKTALTDWLDEDLSGLRSRDLRKALRQGDVLVGSVVKEAARYIGLAVGSLVNLLNPQIVALGGGLMEALAEVMIKDITETASAQAMPGAMKGVTIQATALGDEAGIIGAALLARHGKDMDSSEKSGVKADPSTDLP
jgi:glucokinase